jgi:protein translocase SecG subunit
MVPGASGPIVNTTIPQAAPHMGLDIFHGFMLVFYFVLSAALIVCVMFQTTKNEGLSGVIGGAVTSAFGTSSRKKSSEELLGLWTTRLAVAFIFFSLVIWLLFGRVG